MQYKINLALRQNIWLESWRGKGEWVWHGVNDIYGRLSRTRERVSVSICILCLFLPAIFGSSISTAHV